MQGWQKIDVKYLPLTMDFLLRRDPRSSARLAGIIQRIKKSRKADLSFSGKAADQNRTPLDAIRLGSKIPRQVGYVW